MILTVTANPAVDQTMFVGAVEMGEVNRAHETQLDPAGKGINASRVAHRLGWPTIAFGFLAGETGRIVSDALDAEGVQRHFIQVPGQTRINITVSEGSGRETSVFGPGPAVQADQLDQLADLLAFWLQAARVLVLAGSLPPGAPEDWYAGLLRDARARGVVTLLDTHGPELRCGIAARPDVIKPNLEEAAELLGRELVGREAILDGARQLSRDIRGTAIVSMGADGALCVRGESSWRVVPPSVARKSTVGSGDSFVAGLAVALARGDELSDGLRLAAAAGAATAASAGTSLGSAEAIAELLPKVTIERL